MSSFKSNENIHKKEDGSDYLAKSVAIALFENELENIRELSCSLDHFSQENVMLEKKVCRVIRQNYEFE